MKLMCVVLMSVVLSACGSSSDSPTDGGDINEPDNSNPVPDPGEDTGNTNPGEDTGNNPTPDEEAVNTNPDGSTGTAVFGFGPIQAREGNQPADIDDWYNLFWFDPSPPHQESTIADWQNAVASATAEAELLNPILVAYINEVYSSVEAGILFSEDPVVQTVAVAAHEVIDSNINRSSNPCGVIENGIVTSWACAEDLKVIYEVPGGGKILVHAVFINNNDIETTTFELGNTDTADAEKGYGVQWDISTQLDPQLLNRKFRTSIDNPTLPARFADNLGPLSGIDVVRNEETQAFNAAAFMMRTLRTGQ